MDTDRQHAVVLTNKEQYSIWPTGQDRPDGWRAAMTSQAGVSGS